MWKEKTYYGYQLRNRRRYQYGALGIKRTTLRDVAYLTICALVLIGLINIVDKNLHKPQTIVVVQAATQQLTPKAMNELIVPIPSPTAIPTVTPTTTTTPVSPPQADDIRIFKIRQYLESKGSPLAPYADYIVSEADEYGIAYTLTTAISGKESSFGRNVKPFSHNAWGIGGASNLYYFNSWQEGIQYESELLGDYYGYNAAKGIQTKYCPDVECASDWAQFVSDTQKEILTAND